MENGAVQIYYGEGHGKTNVAIGSAICAACEGKQAVVIQFLKGKKEPEFLKKLEPEVKFFNFSRAGILFEQLDEESKQEEIMNIKNGFNYAKKVISTGADMVGGELVEGFVEAVGLDGADDLVRALDEIQ